ncbi:MAG: hypothetical protein HY363_01590 [Candidatus Aenigmarchaeota archaeon]|nr:hypothetical protein [Candidatus Aenigmarchaeota archaeon]
MPEKKCSTPKVNAKTVKDAEDAVRDLKNWVFVFAKEYDLPEEAIKMLHAKVDEVAQKIGAISCK